MTAAELLARLEAISRERPDRVLRLIGTCPSTGADATVEPFEALLYRGFSSSTTHPTGFDPDQPVVPSGVVIHSAEVLQGPLNPAAEQLLAGPAPADLFLDPRRWP